MNNLEPILFSSPDSLDTLIGELQGVALGYALATIGNTEHNLISPSRAAFLPATKIQFFKKM